MREVMLICNGCGETVSEDRAEYETSYQYDGNVGSGAVGSYTRLKPCSCCGGTFVPAKKCELCDTYLEASCKNDWCDACFDAYSTVDNAFKLGAVDNAQIMVNDFVASLLTFEKIEEILTEYVRKNYNAEKLSLKAREYCGEYRDFFEGWVRDH